MILTKRKVKLEDIGFYTLSDARAKNASIDTPLWRCEVILTDRCNFKCPYCRGSDCTDLPFGDAMELLRLWTNEGLKNVRFSGGEPTLYHELPALVKYCSLMDVEHIAISTNGSSSKEKYLQLIAAGVNDFSISLDACCAEVGDEMSGGVKGSWEKVIENIKFLSKLTYVTVGMVFDEKNVHDCINSVLFADSLGVSDIRVIPSAQYNVALGILKDLPEKVLNKYPILKYRIDNLNNGDRPVRGLSIDDSHKCNLAIDDMAVMGMKHYPCIIHLREGGKPIGKVGPNMRQERKDWIESHNSYNDPICKKNCLDVCIHYNNRSCGK